MFITEERGNVRTAKTEVYPDSGSNGKFFYLSGGGEEAHVFPRSRGGAVVFAQHASNGGSPKVDRDVPGAMSKNRLRAAHHMAFASRNRGTPSRRGRRDPPKSHVP
jgi:hypothetical protein